MPWKETSHERNHLQLRERIVFVASTQKLFNQLPAPRQTFLMTLALLGNTYRKIKLRLHYKKHSLASLHLERQAYTYISLGFSSISKGLIMSKGYYGPHYAMLGLNPSGLICCFNSHPKKKRRALFFLFKIHKIMTLTQPARNVLFNMMPRDCITCLGYSTWHTRVFQGARFAEVVWEDHVNKDPKVFPTHENKLSLEWATHRSTSKFYFKRSWLVYSNRKPASKLLCMAVDDWGSIPRAINRAHLTISIEKTPMISTSWLHIASSQHTKSLRRLKMADGNITLFSLKSIFDSSCDLLTCLWTWL